HEYGSLGCSGDLAPLSACALVVMGEGVAEGPDGVAGPADEVLKAAGITPVTLAEKEGLALVNGTDGMLGMLIMALTDLENLLTAVDVSAAMSIDGLFGTDAVFAPELHYALRPHAGQPATAANMLTALKDSALTASHRESTHLVQDAYTTSCARTTDSPPRRRTCSPRSRTRPSQPAIASRPTSSRTPTRCAAPRRSTAPPAMPSPSPPASPNANCARPSTTRSCSPTGWCPRTATSTERPWPTPWTSSPSSPPMSPRWPSVAPTG